MSGQKQANSLSTLFVAGSQRASTAKRRPSKTTKRFVQKLPRPRSGQYFSLSSSSMTNRIALALPRTRLRPSNAQPTRLVVILRASGCRVDLGLLQQSVLLARNRSTLGPQLAPIDGELADQPSKAGRVIGTRLRRASALGQNVVAKSLGPAV
jgi:hypothetical protein